MIKREFWEKIAGVWSQRDEIKIPDSTNKRGVSEEQIDLDEVEDWDALLKEFLSPDSDLFDLDQL